MLKTLFDIQKVFTHEHTYHYELYYKYNSTYSRVTDIEFSTRQTALEYIQGLID